MNVVPKVVVALPCFLSLSRRTTRYSAISLAVFFGLLGILVLGAQASPVRFTPYMSILALSISR